MVNNKSKITNNEVCDCPKCEDDLECLIILEIENMLNSKLRV